MLAVTHEATITGAPMNLLHLLRWVKRNTDIEVHTLVLHEGPMLSRFEEIGDVTVLDRSAAASSLALLERGLTQLGSTRALQVVRATKLTPQLRHLRGFDVIYLNSASSIRIAPHLPPARAVVSHVHELQVALRAWEPSRDRDHFLALPDRWIAASEAVRTMLVDEFGLSHHQVLLHHEFIDAESIASRRPGLRQVERLRREKRIPTDAAVVMGAGTIEWRKGPDLFVQLAAEVRRRTRDPVAFVWVGGQLEGREWIRVHSDMERAGADHVHFVGTHWDPMPWFLAADLFVLTSREDPFPLVALEHAAMGHPIVSYRSGGIEELLVAAGEEAALGMVDHLDVGEMADRVIGFLNSDRQRHLAGAQLRRRVLSEHDVSVAAPRLIDDLRALVNRGVPGGTMD